MSGTNAEKVEELVNYIMKKCLWQFHSRAWDRERQNAGILGLTERLLKGENVETDDPSERCYLADAIIMTRGFRHLFSWLEDLNEDEIGTIMTGLKERIDFLTIKGSLNEELTDPKY